MLNAECQKDRNEKSHLIRWLRSDFSVIQAGFEPTTHSLEGCCSIQLSYWTIFLRGLKKALNRYLVVQR